MGELGHGGGADNDVDSLKGLRGGNGPWKGLLVVFLWALGVELDFVGGVYGALVFMRDGDGEMSWIDLVCVGDRVGACEGDGKEMRIMLTDILRRVELGAC